MKNKLFLTFALIAFAFGATAQSLVNRLTATVIESPLSSIGTFEDYNFSGVVSHNNGIAIGLLNDFTLGNLLFLGDGDSLNTALNGGIKPGITYYPPYRTFEVTANMRFYNDVILKSSKLKIGAVDGVSGFLVLQGNPASSTDDSYEIGTVLSDDNFVYIRTSSGRWKRLILMDVDFSW